MPSIESPPVTVMVVASGKFHRMNGAAPEEMPARLGVVPVNDVPVTFTTRGVAAFGTLRKLISARLSRSAAEISSTLVTPAVRSNLPRVPGGYGASSGEPWSFVSDAFARHPPRSDEIVL